ncbi:MAG: hypothetical protein A2Z21_04705 [Candidatus Fraserbacteria bacterium RBG_16_55_9]|uniref:Blue (type 1) copper domain-containing protein n=1 Tax=Fraserbacteria sp. (strain RBG_16_55_9) TaxID=1817864 RepID=A0A1F5UV92_FRAXR|nr:MAG: hypothetical protein A2Z21_04705 [Candidatus Fraserbacteria bacterium RBG_16_55_9]
MDNRLLILIGVLLMGFVLIFIAHPFGGPGPSNAETQNWTVLAGKGKNDESLQALRFLPENIVIHVGDSITWELGSAEEHTIYFTAGELPPALVEVGPDGRDYFNPAIFFPSEGTTNDGTAPFSGGVLSGSEAGSESSSSLTLTFTRPGIYEYLCMFHPGMKGTVSVVPRDQPLPMTPEAYAQMGRAEAKPALDAAEKLHRQLTKPKVSSRPDGASEYTLDMVGDTKTMGSVMQFSPTPLHIKVGDTVTWRMLDYTEFHTVTFLDNPDEIPEVVNVEPQENGPPLLVVNPMAWKAVGGSVHSGSGYYNSGAMFRPEGELTPTYSLTFTKPGTYEYVCILHAYMGMKGTIIVESVKSAQASKSPILALVDYTSHTGKAGEADGIAVIDLNPHSSLFGKIMQQVSIGPGVSPHHIYYNHDGSKLYTTALGGARLYRIEMMGERIQQVIPIDTGPCQVGEDLYFTKDGSKYYLTCMGSHMVAIFDAYTDTMIGQIQAPAPDSPYIKHPHGMAVNEELDRMIVTETVSPQLDDPGASVTVIELSTGKALSTHAITKDGTGGSAPVEVFFLPDQPVAYVTAMFEGSLWAGVWDANTRDFQFTFVEDFTARGQGVPLEMYVGPDGYLYVSFGQPGGVNVYDISQPLAPKFLKTLPADAGAHHIAFSEDGKYMFVQNNLLNLDKLNAGTISVVDLETGQLAATVENLIKQGLEPASLVLLRQPKPKQNDAGMMPTAPTPAQGFTLHIDAKKHINDMPDQVVHHYCKGIDSQVTQCLLFDGDERNAHLIGAETIISPEIYGQLPEEEKANWHYHKDEIPLVDAQLPGLSDEEAQKVVAAIQDTYGKVVIFWEPGTPAPIGAPSITRPQSGHQMAEITIKAKDYSFDAPDQLEAGLVSVTLKNNGAELHHVQLARLHAGVTMKDLQDALATSPESAFGLLEWAGGVSILPPNGKQEVILDLKPGHYVMLCFVSSPSDGVLHLAKGMIRSIEVVASGYSVMVPEPKSDVSISLVDFAFDMPQTIKAGKQIWRITNEGEQPHEMTLIKLADGKTIEDALSFLQSQSPEGPPPFEMVGGMQALDHGKTGWAVLDLSPGDYAALCFVPDPTSGKAHIELGMIGGFSVK